VRLLWNQATWLNSCLLLSRDLVNYNWFSLRALSM
jgi:hypothetical protein